VTQTAVRVCQKGVTQTAVRVSEGSDPDRRKSVSEGSDRDRRKSVSERSDPDRRKSVSERSDPDRRKSVSEKSDPDRPLSERHGSAFIQFSELTLKIICIRENCATRHVHCSALTYSYFVHKEWRLLGCYAVWLL
jgi:hypothetical protein